MYKFKNLIYCGACFNNKPTDEMLVVMRDLTNIIGSGGWIVCKTCNHKKAVGWSIDRTYELANLTPKCILALVESMRQGAYGSTAANLGLVLEKE